MVSGRKTNKQVIKEALEKKLLMAEERVLILKEMIAEQADKTEEEM